jgi:hypothetical protein
MPRRGNLAQGFNPGYPGFGRLALKVATELFPRRRWVRKSLRTTNDIPFCHARAAALSGRSSQGGGIPRVETLG